MIRAISKVQEPRVHSEVGYRPRNRSGGYAILIGLLEGEQEGLQAMRRKEIVSKAQYHSDASVIQANKNLYSTWSSFGILFRKGLVSSSGRPLRYTLTSNGRKMALQFQNQIELEQASSYEICQSEPGNSNTSPVPLSPIPSPKMDQNQSNSKSETASTSTLVHSNENSSDDQSTVLCANSDTITLLPDSYEIVLICDLMEYQVLLNSDRRKVKVDLFQDWIDSGIKYESRHLTCGDFIWVARSDANELVLPYIVERKRLDDLSKSIIDNRYHEQKERLTATGLKPIYLIEMHSFKGTLDRDTLMNAVFLTNIRDDFIVKFTRDVFETMRYFVNFTTTLIQLYQGRTLHSKSSESLSEPMDTSLMLFPYFQKRFTKTVPVCLSDVFAKQLLQIPRITEYEASAIINEYPTLSDLLTKYKELDEKDGRKVLEDIRLNSSSTKRIGPNISINIYNLYNS